MALKDNIYIDLKSGDRITLRNGDVLSYDEYYDKITNKDDSRTNYTDTLKHTKRKELDIIEVKRPIEYTTIFTEADRKEEDEEVTIDDIYEEIEKQLEMLDENDLHKGQVIHLNIQL